MAVFSVSQPMSLGIRRMVARVADRAGVVLAKMGECNRAARAGREFATLSRMSDEALAQRGLRREQIYDVTFGRLNLI